MSKFVALRFLILLYFVGMAIFIVSNLRPIDLPEPVRQEARADGCVVSEESSQVHYKEGERNYEEAWIDHVNDDNTVQVTTVDTKLSLLFWIRQSGAKCFRKGSIAQVTIAECSENPEGECDFSLSHNVYIRTEPVQILNWKYKDAS